MSVESYDVNAYAKINLFLRVCGTLPNGYHKLYTVMQEVDIADDITMSFDDSCPEKITIKSGEGEALGDDNLCYIATDKFYAHLHKKCASKGENIKFPKTDIELTKRIPSQAGMGGGSADAAAVLLVLQEHFGQPFSNEEMEKLALSCGADVPFFLYGGTCLCEGVGEIVTPLKSLSGIDVLIVKPKEGVPTPACFKAIDSRNVVCNPDKYAEYVEALSGDGEYENSKAALDAFIAGEELLVNDLQSPAVEIVPQISKIIETLEGKGAEHCAMTGSGSAVFALFDDEAKARDAAADVKFNGCDVFVTKTI